MVDDDTAAVASLLGELGYPTSVARAVDEARRRGCSAIEVTTAERRDDAHRFCEQVGFSRTSLRFVRGI